MSRSSVLRGAISTLLVSGALTTISYAQTTPAQPSVSPQPQSSGTAPAQPNANSQPPSSASPSPQSNPPQNFGTVYATEPNRGPNVALAQPGLTSSPTDYGAVLQRAANTTGRSSGAGASDQAGTETGQAVTVTPGGVTRQDIGGGYMILEQATKTRSTVTRDAIDKQSPTSNPFQLINLLPGVLQYSADNTGLNKGNIRIRGFNSDHIGLTIEGVPINDAGGFALYPQQYLDAENIGQISIAQGLPDLDSPHVGATGGVINVYLRDPAAVAGGLVDFSVGSNNLTREFFRADSGEINGVSAYVSYSHIETDHWFGPGHDERDHLDFKMKWQLNSTDTVRFSALYNDQIVGNYSTPTKADFSKPYSAWSSASSPIISTLPSTFSTPSATGVLDQGLNSANRYQDYTVNPSRNLILSAPSNFAISENLKFDTIPYFWYGFANGGGATALAEQNYGGTGKGSFFWGDIKVTGVDLNGNGSNKDRILYYTPQDSETYRPGIINKFTYTAGDHQFIFGNWFEYSSQAQTQPLEALNPNGSVKDPFGQSGNYSLPTGAVCNLYNANTKVTGAAVACPTGSVQGRDSSLTTISNSIFVGDTWRLTNRLDLIYGVKQLFVQRNLENDLPGQTGTSLFDTATLPSVGARYKLDQENTVFGSFGTTFRTQPNNNIATQVSLSTGAITPGTLIKPESGENFEIGHRYQGPLFATSVSAFYGIYDNFQQSTNQINPDTGSSIAVVRNIGGLMNYGIDAEVGTRPLYNFRPYVSAELLHTELLDNLPTVSILRGKTIADFLPTKGKDIPGAPGYSLGVGIDYDNGHWFGNLAFKYIGPQYSTYMNDEKIDPYGRLDASIGYRFSDFGYFKAPELKLGLYNILDTSDLTGVNSIQTNAKAINGVNGGLISAASPTYYLGQDFSVLLTLRTGF